MVLHLRELSCLTGARCLKIYFSFVVVCNAVQQVCRIIWCRFFLGVCFSCLVLSIVCDVDLMLIVISLLSCCSPGRFSNSKLVTVLARRKIRRAGSFRVVVSRASVGQWLNWDRIL